MNPIYTIGCVVSFLILVYLIVALLKPEVF